MSWLVNDFNIKKQAEGLGVSVWQAPSFLFIILGIVIISVMTAVFIVSRSFMSTEFLLVVEAAVVIIILIVGNIVIRGMEKLAQVNRSKSEFVSVISHQLKTPLTGISWDIELFISKYRDGLVPRQIEILNHIASSNLIMSRMVNDLLDVARIDQNNLFTRKDEMDIVEVIRKIVAKNEVLTKDNNVSVNLLVDDNMPKIIGDEKRTEVVLDNFISNAIKYNKNGGNVSVKAGKDGKRVVISIKDTGIGIPEKEQKMIFDKFFRGEEAAGKEISGTGLGLYIAKNIIEKSGGKVWFHSVKDEGSTFYFSLPIA